MVDYLTESFGGATNPDNWVGLGTAASGQAFLTAGAGGPDAGGTGVLRLTGAASNTSGYAIYNTPISTAGGLSIEFEYATYGGGTPGGDGFSLFLLTGDTDPTAVTFNLGGTGAGLGYAPRSALGGAPAPGIVGGYLGIGFDEFGNFSNFNETTGVPDDGSETAQPNTVAVRGSAANTYNILGRSAELTAGISGGATRTEALRRVLVNLTTEGDLDVFIDLNNDGDFADPEENVLEGLVTDTTGNPNPVPSTVKLGFAGSTGGATNIHEIRNLTVSSLAQTPDLLWRDDSQAKIWYLQNTNQFVDEKTLKFSDTNPAFTDLGIAGQTVDLTRIPGWKAVATVDVDKNGVADIIWQENQTGNSAIWYLGDGATVLDAKFVTLNGAQVNPGLAWELVGTGDINKDGNVDLCWRNEGGDETAFWYLEGGTTAAILNGAAGAVYATNSDGSRVQTGESARWKLSSIGDYDGDGDSDLFYRDKIDGRTAVWIMEGSQLVKGQFLPTVDPSLNEVASGDFNGDGKVDIVFRKPGQNLLWTITSTGTGAATTLTATPSNLFDPGTAWELGGSGDFNGDGTDDLAWNSSPSGDGTVALWFFQNSALNGSTYIETIGTTPVKKTAPLSQFIAGVNEFGNPTATPPVTVVLATAEPPVEEVPPAVEEVV